MTYDEEIIKEATEIYEKNENGGALVGDLLRIIKSQKAHIEKFEKVEHFATKTIEKQTAEIERKTTECERLEIYMDELVKRKLKQVKSEAYREFAEKITEIFLRYAHLHSHADCARKDYIKADDGTEIEMQSVWDVFTLKKYGIAEYEEMSRLQQNIENIANERLLTELEKDFRLLAKELTEK